jgi:membrane-associated phospholipid phosphatase
MIGTITNFGDLAVLLPLALVITAWLVALRQPRSVLWWLAAVGLCMTATAVLKIYFYVCPPLSDLRSPSGHTSLSTLIYGTLALAVATVVTGWKRAAVLVAGAAFVAAIGVSRVLVEAHSVPEVVSGSLIGIAALALFARQFWPRRPTEPRLQPMLVTAMALMVMLNGQQLRAEDLLHALGVYLNHAGMTCF